MARCRGGRFFYTEVEGDFLISASVLVNRRGRNSTLNCEDCLGGLMARNGNDRRGENYVYIAVGSHDTGLGIETKTTSDDRSKFTTWDHDKTEFQLRMERAGDTFTVWSRDYASTAPWDSLASWHRPDLPDTLQLGFNIHYIAENIPASDLGASFEDVRIDAY